jgi:hypothetical protein
MKLRIACVIVGFLSLVLSLTPLTVAQTSAQTASALPRLVRFGGTVKDFNGNPLTGVVRKSRRRCTLAGDAERHRRQQRPLYGSAGIDQARRASH